MGSLFAPVGPHPPATYWRRRLVLLVVVVALVLGVAKLLGGPGTARTANGAGPTSSPTASRASTPGTPAASNRTTPPPSTHPASSGGPVPCTSVSVGVATDALSYSSGSIPQLTAVLHVTGRTTCTVDLGSSALHLLVSTKGSVIWDSADCRPDPVHDVQTVAADGRARRTIVWPRDASTRGCPSGQPTALPGSYSVTATYRGQSSAAVTVKLK